MTSRLKTLIRTSLTLITLSLLPSACQQPVPLPAQPGSVPPAESSAAPAAKPDTAGFVTLEDESGKPIPYLNVRYRQSRLAGPATPSDWFSARTDSQGRFASQGSDYQHLELQAEGYWGYDWYYTDPARIRLAAYNEIERSGKRLDPVAHELFRVRGSANSTDGRAKGFAQLFETDAKTGQTSFQVRTSAELESVQAQLARLTPDTLIGPGPSSLGTAPIDAAALMRKALSEGKRLVGYSNNKFFRSFPQVDALFETADSYYFPQNRTQAISPPGVSAHSYDDELIVYALPANGKPIVFDTSEGKLSLKP